ncbi:MAG: glycosyltransferase, partial [Phycisphaerales bacterium]
DTVAAEHAPVMEREVAGIPDGVALLVSAANKLRERMLAGSFCADLCAFLRQQPRAHWVGIGRGDFSGVRGACERAGVGAQVTIVGAVRDVRPYFKMADVTLNEYPEGGYTTVMESMACGTPVVALAAGVRHAECAGAHLVGGTVLQTGSEYWGRVAALCADDQARLAVGTAQRARAREHFSLTAIAREYERILTS